MRVRWGLQLCVFAAGFLAACLLSAPVASAETVAPASKVAGPVRIDYVAYRAAHCETGKVVEAENERPNEGGLIRVYFTNVSEQPVKVTSYTLNGKEAAHWRLGGSVAWDRMLGDSKLAPGAMGIVEVDAIAKEFGPGQSLTLSLLDADGESVASVTTKLSEDSVQISGIRVLPGLRTLEAHVRHAGNGQSELTGLQVIGARVAGVKWVGQSLTESGHAIARVELEAPMTPLQTAIVKLTVKDGAGTRSVYANRRAFEDYFPIGTWSNAPDTYAVLRRLHIDTVIKGGTAQDAFFTTDAAKYGLRAIVPAEGAARIDTLRGLGENPNVTSWLLGDEPDWSMLPAVLEHLDASVKEVSKTKPTFVTLCRNVKFFEYAPIVDIPCMDHYCVTAPSSSTWQKPYGTRLEETAYYTHDLKAASEPNPIWVWSQALGTWDKRPQRPVPTADELAAQLMLNLGRGARGVLWFNYNSAVAEKFPDVGEAMRGWGRALSVMREDFLASGPIATEALTPAKVDTAALASSDKLILCVTNLNYEIDPKAYRFAAVNDATVSVVLPSWVKPAVALSVGPDGVKTVPFEAKDGRAKVSLGDLDVCRMVVLANDASTEAAYKSAYDKAVEDEKKEF